MNEAYPKSAAVGRMSDDTVGNGIDINKCYSWALQSISQVPVFHYFDNYVKYDNHIIEDLTMYVVMSLDGGEAHNILLPKRYNRVYGFKLKQMDKNSYDVLYYIRPSNIATVKFSKAVDELYETDLGNINANKFINNKITGQLEKKYNHTSVCKIYKNLDEANHYKKLYGGEINPISDDLFLLVRTTKKLVRETFKPIKDMIYDLVSIKMFNLYNKCLSVGLEPIAIKTDCIIVRDKVDKIKPHFDFNKDIGGVKLEEGDYGYGSILYS